MKKIKFLILAFIVSMLCVGCGAPNPLALKSTSFTVGLGEEIDTDPSTYLETTDEQVLKETKFNFKNVDTSKAGVYRATASYDGKRVEFRIEVVDQGTPVAEVRTEIYGEPNKRIPASAILSSILEGEKKVTVTFRDHGCEWDGETLKLGDVVIEGQALLYEENGEYENVLTLTDPSGNSADFPFHIVISENPVILGTEDITAEVGANIDYLSGVTAEDSDGNDITDDIEVDHSAVDDKTPGTYEVIYSVTDAKGRTGKSSVKVKIIEKKVDLDDTEKDDSKNNTNSNSSTGSSQKVDKKPDTSSNDSSSKKDTTTKKPAEKPSDSHQSTEQKPADKDTQKPADKDNQKPADKDNQKPADKDTQKPADKDTQKPADKDNQKPTEQEPSGDDGDEENDHSTNNPDDSDM